MDIVSAVKNPQTLYTFRKSDYIDMIVNVQELFEHLSYLDSCSFGKTDDMQRCLDASQNCIDRLKTTLDFKFLYPSLQQP